MVGRLRWSGRAAAAAIGLAALALSGCSVRWETEPSPVPVADSVTLDRDALADAEAAVARAAERATGPLATLAAVASSAHVDALGGVYVAYPNASPSPGATPAPEPELVDAIEAARTLARDIATSTDDDRLSAIATSIDLDWALRIAWSERGAALVDGVTSADAGARAARPLPLPNGTPSPAGFAPSGPTEVEPGSLADLALGHDQARFSYETAAAQLFVQERDQALARAAVHESRSDALVALVAEPVDRTPLYQLRDVDLLDPEARRAFLVGVEVDLGARYAALAAVAADSDREWLLNGAFDAYVTAMDAGGITAAQLPVLPGLVLADA